MKRSLEQAITEICHTLFNVDIVVDLTRPDEQFGDYATNVSMQLAGRLKRNPREIADLVIGELTKRADVAHAELAGPGFINVAVHDQVLIDALFSTPSIDTYKDKVVVAEYSDPNPFKQLHAGHLYTTLIGDVIARLYEVGGAKVHRTNFGGDVGLHVARNMWAIIKFLGGEKPEKLEEISADPHQRSAWMSARYIEGTAAYESNESSKQEIIKLNAQIYELHAQNDHESPFAQIYWTCRDWSYGYFKVLYSDLEVTPFERYYPESETVTDGVKAVRDHIGSVYHESDGAIVFRGEEYGLHTRVFINSNGLPTYETKDVGLILRKWHDYNFDLSLIITAADITEYMKVVLKSIEQFNPELTSRTRHITHGTIKLTGGIKMSSRLGNGVLALDVLDAAREASQKETGASNEGAVLGAVKYAFLKQRIGADIIYDPIESVALQGNSGPYLQYAHARACSILSKADNPSEVIDSLDAAERSLARKISEYDEVLQVSVEELMPHYICTYLYELAQVFNRFYEHNRVIDDPRELVRVALVRKYAETLKAGLEVLGINAPESM